jgi:hypothetical protein
MKGNMKRKQNAHISLSCLLQEAISKMVFDYFSRIDHSDETLFAVHTQRESVQEKQRCMSGQGAEKEHKAFLSWLLNPQHLHSL